MTIIFVQVSIFIPLQWSHNERDDVSNRQPNDCLLKRLFKAQIKETSKLRGTGVCEGNSPGTGEFPAQRASNAENVSIWLRHYSSIYDADSSSLFRFPFFTDTNI